jgi:hypothetical protein
VFQYTSNSVNGLNNLGVDRKVSSSPVRGLTKWISDLSDSCSGGPMMTTSVTH